MAPANIRGASATHCHSTLATNRSSALAMDRRGVLAMNRLSVLRMHRCLARPVSVAHEPTEVESVIVCNFAPALPALMQRDDIVKTLASGVCYQMRVLQAAPAKTSRCSFRLQRCDGNYGCRRNSVYIGFGRRNGAEHQNECVYVLS